MVTVQSMCDVDSILMGHGPAVSVTMDAQLSIDERCDNRFFSIKDGNVIYM